MKTFGHGGTQQWGSEAQCSRSFRWPSSSSSATASPRRIAAAASRVHTSLSPTCTHQHLCFNTEQKHAENREPPTCTRVLVQPKSCSIRVSFKRQSTYCK